MNSETQSIPSESISVNTQYFSSFESQLDRFVDLTNITILPMTSGNASFLQKLGSWFMSYSTKESSSDYAYILPNPALGMSFPNSLDVITTVLRIYLRDLSVEQLNHQAKSLLKKFGLEERHFKQPLTSLSGGEMLLLSYAKAYAMIPLVNGLVACSPRHWLNKSRYQYWNLLLNSFHKEKKEVHVFLMDGEETNEKSNYHNQILVKNNIQNVNCSLDIGHFEAVFSEVEFPEHFPEHTISFKAELRTKKLNSPILITGDNGVGKSVFAKLLSGVYKSNEKEVSVSSINGKGQARLIFQDSIDQLFGMTIDGHSDWVYKYDSKKSKKSYDLYEDLESSIREGIFALDDDSISALGEAEKKQTLLQTKIALAAERIAAKPPLLILDEPGWGLSRKVATVYMNEVCFHAHENGVAIAIISHQPSWWSHIARSNLELSKTQDKVISIVKTNGAE